MEPIELIMKIWGIDESCRDDLEKTLRSTSPEHLGLSLANLSVCSDDKFSEASDVWMDTYLPEVQFK